MAVTPSLLRKWTLSDVRKMNGYAVYFSAQSGVMEAASERNLSGFLTFLNSYKVEQEKWPFLNEVWDIHCFGGGGGLGVSFYRPLQPSQRADSLFAGFPRQDRPSRPPRCGRPSGETQPPLASLVVPGPRPFGRDRHARRRRSPHPQGVGAARGVTRAGTLVQRCFP